MKVSSLESEKGMDEESASMYEVSTVERNGHRGLRCLGHFLRGKIQKGKEMKRLVKFLWQLPQNIIGLLLVMAVRADTTKRVDGKKIWYSERMRGAVTLGEYIVINMDKYYSAPTSTERHEIGHYKQSLIFGWLYLFIIGIPSIIHAILHKGGNYGHFYTELWADEVEELKIPMVWLSVVLHLVVIFTILLLV